MTFCFETYLYNSLALALSETPSTCERMVLPIGAIQCSLHRPGFKPDVPALMLEGKVSANSPVEGALI